jgi:hypothetical protein
MNIYLKTYLFFNKFTLKLKLSTNFFWLNRFLLFLNHEKVLRALVNLQNKKNWHFNSCSKQESTKWCVGLMGKIIGHQENDVPRFFEI